MLHLNQLSSRVQKDDIAQAAKSIAVMRKIDTTVFGPRLVMIAYDNEMHKVNSQTKN